MHRIYKRENEWAKELQLLLLYGATPTPPPSPESGFASGGGTSDDFGLGLHLTLSNFLSNGMSEEERKRGLRTLASKMMLTRRDRRVKSGGGSEVSPEVGVRKKSSLSSWTSFDDS